jgi:hypothetical protein
VQCRRYLDTKPHCRVSSCFLLQADRPIFLFLPEKRFLSAIQKIAQHNGIFDFARHNDQLATVFAPYLNGADIALVSEGVRHIVTRSLQAQSLGVPAGEFLWKFFIPDPHGVFCPQL